jgi:ribosomal-protein-alanine N-acetyltransferase
LGASSESTLGHSRAPLHERISTQHNRGILEPTSKRRHHVFVGKRLRLRRLWVEDAPLVAEWRSDPMYWGSHANVYDDTPDEWEKEAKKDWNSDQMDLLITDRESGEPLGMIGWFAPFNRSPIFRGLEVGYQVHPSARGRGVATEATCILVNHLFNVRPVERIQATVVVGNEASYRVLERAGMKQEGVLRGVSFVNGRYHDLHLYSIVRGDWKDESNYRDGRDF